MTADFNPLPSHEGRHIGARLPNELYISIHSPRMRGDGSPCRQRRTPENFNPLPSHEGRPATRLQHGRTRNFNPLPSHEGRPVSLAVGGLPADFNPLPSHEGRPKGAEGAHGEASISIHSPRMRGDDVCRLENRIAWQFQSTPLA